MLELATSSDAADINRLSSQVAALHAAWRPDLFRTAEVSYTEETLTELIRERSIFVARIGGIVVGYTAFWIWETNGPCSVPRKVMSINDFCVDEPYRDQGIGTDTHTVGDVSALGADSAVKIILTDLQLATALSQRGLQLYLLLAVHIGFLELVFPFELLQIDLCILQNI